MVTTYDYALCGWRVRSAIVLPELRTWLGDDRTPDIEIVLGPIPEVSREAPADQPAASSGLSPLRVTHDGAVLLDIGGVARFCAQHGSRITIDLEAEQNEAVRLALLGTMLAGVCYQRHLLPLHASGINLGVGAVTFSGSSGAGTSTLAAELMHCGLPLIADEICVLDPRTKDVPVVWPSVARLKLKRDAVDQVGMPQAATESVGSGKDQYGLYDVENFHAHPLPLQAMYHLDHVANLAEPEIKRATGVEAVRLLDQAVYRGHIGHAMGQGAAIAVAFMTILGSVPVFHVRRDRDRHHPAALAASLLGHWSRFATNRAGYGPPHDHSTGPPKEADRSPSP